jgi:hypothetical protein
MPTPPPPARGNAPSAAGLPTPGTERAHGLLALAPGPAIPVRYALCRGGPADTPWRGFLSPDAGTDLPAGTIAALTLADGARGELLITRRHTPGGAPIYSFVGIGPAPGPADPP